jgi:hypothetical protein
MKTLITTVILALFANLSFAQMIQQVQTPGQANPPEAQNTDNYKPETGNKTFEVNFNPFGATPVSFSYLRFRYFLAPDLAARAGVSLGLRGGGDNFSFEYALLPGIEKHFRGTNRLSPFVGAELGIASRASSGSVSAAGNSRRVSGAWLDNSNRSFFNLSLNGILGCDYYISRHLYLGIEAGYGFSLLSSSDIATTDISGGTTTTNTNEGGTSYNLGPNFNSAIRLGFAF